MGEVYLASDTRLGRQVAIKFLRPDRLHGADAQQRVLREARAAAALDHPNICSVFEVGEYQGRPFIVMQFVDGATLASRLKEGRLKPVRALEVASQIAQALHAAHSRGIVHRDIKPQNIILTPEGQAKLLDFGVAKITPFLSPREETESLAQPDSLAGAIVGTPAYMAPEQVARRNVDGRTDLFSLGTVLYECLTGRPAFLSAQLNQTLDDVLHTDPPPPSSIVPDLSRSHDDLCRRLMAKDQDARPGTAEEALHIIRETQHATRQWLPPLLLNRRAMFVAAVLVVSLVAWAGRHFFGMRPASLSAVPESARRWYEQGADAIREGAYTKARRALEQAITQHGAFPLAHARLAEAFSELDESGSAKTELLKVRDLVLDPSTLDAPDRLRLAAINATVVRDFAAAVASYQQLARLLPSDAQVQVDLGRALERFEQREGALNAYRRAITLEPDSAVAHLRLAVILGDGRDESGAQQAFARARSIYEAASNTEGVVEVLLARGTWLNAHERLAASRQDLELAVRMATDSQLEHQRIRGMLQLSSLTASEGRFEEAESIAAQAVERARTADMDGLAASNLIDVGNVLFVKGRRSDAERLFAQAESIAQRRGAKRTEARAAFSRGSVLVSSGQPQAAVPYVERSLAFFRENHYPGLERRGLTVLASIYAGVGEFERSRVAYSDLLTSVRAAKDEAAIALATERLSGVLIDMGRLPEAFVALRESVDLNRRAGNQAALVFTFAREADLLARLGRLAEAQDRMNAMHAELKAGHEAYVARAASIHLTQARVACARSQWRQASSSAASATKVATSDQVAVQLGAAMASALASANLDRRQVAIIETRAVLKRLQEVKEARLVLTISDAAPWVFDRAGDISAAHEAADAALAIVEKIPNLEAGWRLQALASVSASALHSDHAQAHRLAAVKYIEALQKSWSPEVFAAYSSRPDVRQMRKRIGL